ncbi:hypothetical protein ACFTAO_42760 [Paenibacillus rhizoplanae]
MKNLLEIESIPKIIPTDSPYVEVRGEVYMSNDTFEMVRQRQEERGGKNL